MRPGSTLTVKMILTAMGKGNGFLFFGIAGALIFITGCYSVMTPKCRHQALYAAIVAAENGHPVRIWSGPTGRGTSHAQAQASIADRWEWLDVGQFGEIYTTEQDNFIPTYLWTADEYYSTRFYEILQRMSNYAR